MAQWTVQMFAYLRERHGNSVVVEAEATAGAILAALTEIGVRTEACRLAVNDEFAKSTDSIPQESSLALIPPVSGG